MHGEELRVVVWLGDHETRAGCHERSPDRERPLRQLVALDLHADPGSGLAAVSEDALAPHEGDPERHARSLPR